MVGNKLPGFAPDTDLLPPPAPDSGSRPFSGEVPPSPLPSPDPEPPEPDEWCPPDPEGVGVGVGVGVNVGVGVAILKAPIAETEPEAVAPLATPVAVPVRVTDCPAVAVVGIVSWACICVVWLVRSVPSVHVWVPSPLPQTLKVGVPELVGCAETCTVTLLAGPPVGQTSIANCAVCPGWYVLVTGCTVMQSSVIVTDPEEVADPEEEAPGVIVGVGPGGGELGAMGRGWHTGVGPVVAWDCTPARAAAAVPTPSTAMPANAANTDDPDRPLRRGPAGWDPSCGVNSRFSING